MKVSQIMNTRDIAVSSLAALSVEHLDARIAKLVEMGTDVRRRLDAGERGDFAGTVVRKGRHVPADSLTANLNTLRRAYAAAVVARSLKA